MVQWSNKVKQHVWWIEKVLIECQSTSCELWANKLRVASQRVASCDPARLLSWSLQCDSGSENFVFSIQI